VVTSSTDDILRDAIFAMQADRPDVAERLYRRILQAQPRHVAALNLFAIFLTRLGRFDEAERYIRRALRENTGSDATLYNYGLILKALKRPAAALERFSQALRINASAADTWNNRGTVFNDLKRYDEAISDFDRAIRINPQYADALCNKGKSLLLLKRFDEALSAFQTALEINPNLAEAWFGCAEVHWYFGRYQDSLTACRKALAARDNFVDAWLRLGNNLAKLGLSADALAAYDKAANLQPDLADPWVARATVLAALGQKDMAIVAYDRALVLKPDSAEAWLGRGNFSLTLRQYTDALAAYDRALALKSDLAEAWLGRGNVYFILGDYQQALAAYTQALALRNDLDFAASLRLLSKLSICDWTDMDILIDDLLERVRRDAQANEPLALFAIPSSPVEHMQCARHFVRYRQPFPSIWRGKIYAHDRIRIAYLSADFREHAVAHLTVGLFEHHDRSRFEVTGISFSRSENSPMRNRIKDAFEHFVDVEDKTDQEVAELLLALEIDIVVDLMGHTRGNRLNVLARRAAPIQVNYLGFAGTMGADYIDYILADPIIIPEDHRQFYTEQVVYLPTYQVNDDKREISEKIPTRAECGLPNGRFVFSCFNNTFKILPEMFDIWMRLLQAVDDSVLWLRGYDTVSSHNLRREAERRGVAAERLIFASHAPFIADHLARLRLADLFLDTLPYNAHTTASDALWAGLPVITCLGSAFPGRVAASVLKAAGLDELIATSLADYEALALKLARDPTLVASLKAKIARSRVGCPLFDTDRFCRNIERAYAEMVDIWRRGESPRSFRVETT